MTNIGFSVTGIAPSWFEENQQRETDYQDWQAQRGDEWEERLRQEGWQHEQRQRLAYEEWLAEQQREGFVTDGGKAQGLDHNDFYNIDTAHELEEAIGRAAAQGVDYSNPDKFQRFLENESEARVGQVEGKRSLSDRFQELRQQSQEAANLTERGARPEQIPPVKLYESAQEQQFRVEQEREQRGQERSPARERLAQIRQEHGLNDREREPELHLQQSRGRSR